MVTLVYKVLSSASGSVVLHGMILIICLFLPAQFNAAPMSDEDKLKTALIFKLARFVAWPESSPHKHRTDFGICLLGTASFSETLESLQGRQIKEKTISIKRYSQSRSIKEQCQVVFVAASKKPFFKDIIGYLQDRPILTLSDANGFAAEGGMVQFKQENKRVGFDINLKSVNRSGLKIASQLLELATIVER